MWLNAQIRKAGVTNCVKAAEYYSLRNDLQGQVDSNFWMKFKSLATVTKAIMEFFTVMMFVWQNFSDGTENNWIPFLRTMIGDCHLQRASTQNWA